MTITVKLPHRSAVLEAAECIRHDALKLAEAAVVDFHAGRISDAVDGWRRASEKYESAAPLFEASGSEGSAAMCAAFAQVCKLAAERVAIRVK